MDGIKMSKWKNTGKKTTIKIRNIKIHLDKIHDDGIKITYYRDDDKKPIGCAYIPFEKETEDESSVGKV